MSFIERKITVTITLSDDSFDAGGNTVQLSGLRMQATIENFSGGLGSYGSVMQMRIYGMTGQDMAKLSTMGFSSGIGYKKNSIDVYAGDDDAGLSHIFSGAIFDGRVDYNAMPLVAIDLVANAIYNEQMTAYAGSSFKGDMDVATMLRGIALAAGWSFQNAGVQAKLKNHASGGSIVDQIRDICLAANVRHDVTPGDTKTLVIWPAGGTRNDIVLELSAETGLVGYPEYAMNSVLATSIFNSNIYFGQQIKVITSVPNLSPAKQSSFTGVSTPPGAGGTYYVWSVTHEISSMLPNGPWFTHARLGDNKVDARG